MAKKSVAEKITEGKIRATQMFNQGRSENEIREALKNEFTENAINAILSIIKRENGNNRSKFQKINFFINPATNNSYALDYLTIKSSSFSLFNRLFEN